MRLVSHRASARFRRSILSGRYGRTRGGNGRTRHAGGRNAPLARADRQAARGGIDGSRLRAARSSASGRHGRVTASASIAMLEALQRADFAAVQSLLQNDFHEVIAARSAEIRTALAALRGAGAANAMLAGSGSSVFSIAPERSRIEAVAERLDLAPSYERFVTAFSATPHWRASPSTPAPSTSSGTSAQDDTTNCGSVGGGPQDEVARFSRALRTRLSSKSAG